MWCHNASLTYSFQPNPYMCWTHAPHQGHCWHIFVVSTGVGAAALIFSLHSSPNISSSVYALCTRGCYSFSVGALVLKSAARQFVRAFYNYTFRHSISTCPFGFAFYRWHATDISWPPHHDNPGKVSTAREALEENRIWLEARGVNVCDDVDVFDILSYLELQRIQHHEVVLCIFNCAHGRNYRNDSTERHVMMQNWHWKGDSFRSAAFQAMCGQLPHATCILTCRCWEPVVTQVGTRPILHAPVRYARQTGPPYRPEPSTRSKRRPGELGSTEDLIATVAVGPALSRYILQPGLPVVNIPELALRATGAGHVLFVGEFTLANSRHCAQYVCDQIANPFWNLLWQTTLKFQLRIPSKLQKEHRQDCDENGYTYAQCLKRASEAGEAHAALAAGHWWMNMWCTPQMGLNFGGQG